MLHLLDRRPRTYQTQSLKISHFLHCLATQPPSALLLQSWIPMQRLGQARSGRRGNSVCMACAAILTTTSAMCIEFRQKWFGGFQSLHPPDQKLDFAAQGLAFTCQSKNSRIAWLETVTEGGQGSSHHTFRVRKSFLDTKERRDGPRTSDVRRSLQSRW